MPRSHFFLSLLHTKLPPTECVSSTVKYLVTKDTPQFVIDGFGFGGYYVYKYTASFESVDPKAGSMTQQQLFGRGETYSLGSYSGTSGNTALFTNGTFCGPIDAGRTASIQFLRAENDDAVDCTNLVADQSFEETSICVYEMTVRISEQCCSTYLKAFPP